MPTADEVKAQGNKAFANKEFKKAAKIYRDAIKLDSTNPVLYSNRALCFIKEQDWDRALRDCKDGLLLKPNINTKVKLVYRQGIVHKNLGDILNAVKCFNEVVTLDPQNTAAINELKAIENSPNKKVKLQQSSHISIPINEVDNLPEEFLVLLNAKTERRDELISPKPTKRLNDEINELFGHKQITSNKSEKPNPSLTNSSSFSDRPTMQVLSMLSTLPENQKIGAYKYITTLAPEYYKDVFESTGIDSEFLVFFIEAAAYISTHKTISNWEEKVFGLISTFSKLRRYQLSLLFCHKNHIEEIINNVNELGDNALLENYKALLLN
mmetsp:Transcript_5015/g.5555  ORF Transcript_5015/g.5555 Transcript_5015/m.5555 type:complete len:325 (+) Transcript_5015:96-1070(+)